MRVLHILLGPCFARFVEFQEWEGRKLTWWEQPVSLEPTAGIRVQGLRIVEWVIEHGSWMAALDGLGAAAESIRRVAGIDKGKVEKLEEFRELWRPERMKGLAVYERAISMQNHVVVRYEIRKTLLRDIAYEEDSEFASHCRRVLGLIPDNLTLRTAVALLSQGHFDFSTDEADPRTEEGREKARELWQKRVTAVAEELSTVYADFNDLFDFLNTLGLDFLAADQHPFYEPIFAALAQTAPDVAFGLAKVILAHVGSTPLARAWVNLVVKNSAVANRSILLLQSVSSRCEGVRSATISSITPRPNEDQPTSAEEEAILTSIATNADASETRSLLQFVEWAGPSNLRFAYRLLGEMRLEEHSSQLLEAIFQALVPHHSRQTRPSSETIEKVLAQLLHVPQIDTSNHRREWDELCENYPKPERFSLKI